MGGGGRGRRLTDDQLLSEQSVVDEFSSSSSNCNFVRTPTPPNTYFDILSSYENPLQRTQTLQQYKDAILRHKPGDWIDGAGGLKPTDYEIPEVTTLLLVGPRGSGKSSLINRISRLFEEDEFAPDRAQVSHNLSVTNGSCFLQEYMVPRNSKSLCFYDSRSLSTCKTENFPMLNNWMTQGVSHGQMVMRDSDTVLMRSNIRAMARQHRNVPCQKRIINFVIFVVDGAAVLKSMDNKDAEYDGMLVESFNYPYLSFKDDKPVVVVTHGDKLSFHERARILTHLGEILGIPPSKQIFDIPDSNDLNTELAILGMLRYSIEHADRNLPYNTTCSLQVRRMVESFHFNDWVMLLEFIIIFACLVLCCFRIASWLMKDYFGRERAVRVQFFTRYFGPSIFIFICRRLGFHLGSKDGRKFSFQ